MNRTQNRNLENQVLMILNHSGNFAGMYVRELLLLLLEGVGELTLLLYLMISNFICTYVCVSLY